MTETSNKQQLKSSDELTLIQKVALEGEVSQMKFKSATDLEFQLKAFSTLATCPEQCILVYKYEFSKYLEPEVVDELVRYRHIEAVPVYLYARYFMQEIKDCVFGRDYGPAVMRGIPIKVVRSKVAVLLTEMAKYIPNTTKAYIDAIINILDTEGFGDDSNISCCFLSSVDLLEKGEVEEEEENPLTVQLTERLNLRPLLAVLRDGIVESDTEQHVGYDVKLKLMSVGLAEVPILEFEQEMAKANSDGNGLQEVLKELFGAVSKNADNKQPTQVSYKVKKKDKISGNIVFEKEFETRQKATEYVQNIAKDYPEVAKQYNFEIEIVSK